jgi:transposase
MDFIFFVGIDVSKLTLDLAVVRDGKTLFHQTVANSAKGLSCFLDQAAKVDSQFDPTRSLFCMEHTGLYNNPSLEFFEKHGLSVWLESAMQIRYSQGIKRGKSDKADAIAIADYACKNYRSARLWKPSRKSVKQLRYLVGVRNRLVKAKKALSTAHAEASAFVNKQIVGSYAKSCQASLRAIKDDIERVEQQISQLIQADQKLDALYQQVTSVDGVGMVTAVEIILNTNEFENIADPKKFACHAGVAPFSYSSGSSLRSKAKVSAKANKTLKMLLHMAALSAVQVPGDMRTYYERKISEGKNKMSVLNAVRNKIIHRVFAVVRDERKYEKKYITTLA